MKIIQVLTFAVILAVPSFAFASDSNDAILVQTLMRGVMDRKILGKDGNNLSPVFEMMAKGQASAKTKTRDLPSEQTELSDISIQCETSVSSSCEVGYFAENYALNGEFIDAGSFKVKITLKSGRPSSVELLAAD